LGGGRRRQAVTLDRQGYSISMAGTYAYFFVKEARAEVVLAMKGYRL